ncbi:MAG: hypothetical protein M1819_007159 [Sarea resinae]|nr:MAG: hypothetical protein M1819_007159 [Sarea resinae]
MAPKRWIDKKNATTFQLVHRAQNDPRIHDAEASDMVFKEVAAPNSQKIKHRNDLEEELGLDPNTVRDNEGEAANYGIYYDDTEYDYMQHMRDLGSSTEAYFVEAPKPSTKQQKGKGKQKLEDALREASLDDPDDESAGGVKVSDSRKQLLDDDILPSKEQRKTTYQDQQDIPDALAGFQPDMDPRLREVMEALEDEAYVDDEDDIFGELAKDGKEVTEDEFYEAGWDGEEFGDEDGDGWETDDTAKPSKEYKTMAAPAIAEGESVTPSDEEAGDHGDGDWMKEFSKFKKATKASANTPRNPLAPSDLQSSILTSNSSLTGGRHKKRKGARTSTSGYSMTSSSLFRTEGLTLLDERFDKIEEEYADDENDDLDDGASVATGTTTASSQQGTGHVREDFDSIMDDFLGGYSMSGKRRVKKGGYQSGLEQLEEVRRGLGPARFRSEKALAKARG